MTHRSCQFTFALLPRSELTYVLYVSIGKYTKSWMQSKKFQYGRRLHRLLEICTESNVLTGGLLSIGK